MKKLLIVLGVVAVLATVLSVRAATSPANATGQGNQLVVDSVITFATDFSAGAGRDEGERAYGEADVYEEGQYPFLKEENEFQIKC